MKGEEKRKRRERKKKKHGWNETDYLPVFILLFLPNNCQIVCFFVFLFFFFVFACLLILFLVETCSSLPGEHTLTLICIHTYTHKHTPPVLDITVVQLCLLFSLYYYFFLTVSVLVLRL